MTKQIRIALFLDTSLIGGIESHISNLCQALQRQKRVEVHLILWKDYHKSAINHWLNSLKINVHTVEGNCFKLMSLVKQQQYSILHTHGYKANIIGRLVGLITSIPILSTHHNGDLGSGKLKIYTLIDCWTACLSHNWAVSEQIRQRLPKNAELMTNFINAKACNLPKKNEAIVFVGRLSAEKRADRFISIAKHCSMHQFTLFGDGLLLDSLTQSSPDNVKFMGFQSDPELIWNNASLCIICSDQEGLPMVALEAMARKVPVLATPVGELPSLISHNIDGWLLKTNQEFIDCVHNWFTLTYEQQNDIRCSARKKIIENYSFEACLPTYLEKYLSLTKTT